MKATEIFTVAISSISLVISVLSWLVLVRRGQVGASRSIIISLLKRVTDYGPPRDAKSAFTHRLWDTNRTACFLAYIYESVKAIRRFSKIQRPGRLFMTGIQSTKNTGGTD